MKDFPGHEWVRRFQQRVNSDPEMAVIGDWFTTALSLSFGPTRYVLRIEEGRIVELVPEPKLDERCAFGFRAPLEVWRRFLRPDPPPLYHDFFAMMMRAPEFVLEGDSLAAMQNARALHRLMNLMREAAHD